MNPILPLIFACAHKTADPPGGDTSSAPPDSTAPDTGGDTGDERPTTSFPSMAGEDAEVQFGAYAGGDWTIQLSGLVGDADLDGDGLGDILVGGASQGVLPEAAVAWNGYAALWLVSGASSVDLPRVSLTDEAWTNPSEGNGEGVPHMMRNGGLEPFAFGTDMRDGPTNDYVVAAGFDPSITWGMDGGDAVGLLERVSGPGIKMSAVADIDLDGTDDLLLMRLGTSHDHMQVVYLPGPFSGFHTSDEFTVLLDESYPSPTDPTDLLAGDLTGSGVPSVVLVGDTRADSFTAGVRDLTFEGDIEHQGCSIGDLDGDGAGDLVLVARETPDGASRELAVIRGGTEGEVSRDDADLLLQAETAWYDQTCASADLDGDGAIDLVSAQAAGVYAVTDVFGVADQRVILWPGNFRASSNILAVNDFQGAPAIAFAEERNAPYARVWVAAASTLFAAAD